MIIIGDLHTQKSKPTFFQHITIDLLGSSDKTLVIAGDLSQRATSDQYKKISDWLKTLVSHGVSIVMTPGNHDFSLGLGPIRVTKPKGVDRWKALMLDVLHPVATRSKDAIFKCNGVIFVCLNSTHPKAHLQTAKIRSKQIEWAQDVLIDMPSGYLPTCLVTHHSLWRDRGDTHNKMHKRQRLVDELLSPFMFTAAINGHNHRFSTSVRRVKGFRLRHLQAPTLSRRDKGRYPTGYVTWDIGEEPRQVIID